MFEWMVKGREKQKTFLYHFKIQSEEEKEAIFYCFTHGVGLQSLLILRTGGVAAACRLRNVKQETKR
jgi:hypothetical protein